MDMDRIREKIAHLMGMGHDPRTNKFEADAALRQASKLMAKHAIDLAELADAGGKTVQFHWTESYVPVNPDRPARSCISWVGILSLAIAKFTDCLSIYARHPTMGVCTKYMGETVDVAYAVYLLEHLQRAVRSESAAFVGSRREKEDFRIAMVGRIRRRMEELKAAERAKMDEHTSGGTALVIIDNKIAERTKRFGKQKQRTTRRGSGDAFARAAGRAAGDRVGFGRPVGNESSHRIG